jgi:hypothetical protein
MPSNAQVSFDDSGDKNPSVPEGRLGSNEMTSYTIAVADLAPAYYYAEDVKYLTRAVTLTSSFFLDPETRMNPNLELGQMWPRGMCCGKMIWVA